MGVLARIPETPAGIFILRGVLWGTIGDRSRGEGREESIAPNNRIEPNRCQRLSWRTGCLDDQPAKVFFAPTRMPSFLFVLILSLSAVPIFATP